MLPRVVDAFQL
jgi:hypothetical protein